MPAAHETVTAAGRRVTLRRATLGEILSLRHAELRPGVALDSARFEGDAEPATLHFGAFVAAAEVPTVVGCASFMARARAGEDAYQLRGMATRADVTRRGIGGALLRHALTQLTAHDRARVFWCNARVAAVPFYRRMGWRVVSDAFDVPSVGPHHVMIYRATGGE